MTTKRLFGYVFILVAVILTLTVVGRFPELLSAVVGAINMLTGSLDGYQSGKVIGSLIYWAVHFALTVTLFIYGRRWIRKLPQP